MAELNLIPEFTTDEGTAGDLTPTVEETTTEEKETPTAAATEPTEPAQTGDDTDDLKAQLKDTVEGLKEAKRELIKELGDLRGQKRDLKKQEIAAIDQKVDDLKDVHPDDVALIERTLRAKGYVSQGEVNKMFYEARKQEEISKFLSEFPEYKPENDADNKKWSAIVSEASLYKEPDTPEGWATILRRAHRATGSQTVSDRTVAVKKHNVQVAGVGSGGGQRSSSYKPFTPDQRWAMEKGGYTSEEISNLEKSRK
ncbi:MAG: hypothetical protein WAV09_01610 [Minisyncoccia bacterium]